MLTAHTELPTQQDKPDSEGREIAVISGLICIDLYF